MAAEQADTIVGAQVELKGSLKNTGPVHIYGKVIGDIISDGLVVVGETAIIQGPITAKQVDISGQVQGTITAKEHIELQAKSIVRGDLITNRLSIKAGAIFIGKSQMGESKGNEEFVEEGQDLRTEKKKPRLELE